MRLRMTALAVALAATALTPSSAQRREPSPEQRIDRLEKQVRQVQKRVFPKGQPADTAGVVDDPAATMSTVNILASRLDAVERQMAELIRTSEENANRLATVEAELFRLRAEQDQQSTMSASDEMGSDDDGSGSDGPPPAPQPKFEDDDSVEPAADEMATSSTPVIRSTADPDFIAAGEAEYDRGYQLWNSGRYDQAIVALRAMASAFPGHRRVSWARNLAGRALLDKGEYRAAAEALLANYRADPRGERAADSLYFLGQASFKLGQPGQACKAYSELENVYGATMRGYLRENLPAAKRAANCG